MQEVVQMDFSHLKKLDIKEQTTEYTLYQIEGEPVLTMKPANEANKPYFNQVLKKSRRKLRRIQSGNLSTEFLEENRELDRQLFPKTVIIDWKGVKDSAGKTVPFTQEACAEFLQALPDWLFDEVRNHAAIHGNFVEEVADVEEKAKNSKPA
jgi:hypothetical protein